LACLTGGKLAEGCDDKDESIVGEDLIGSGVITGQMKRKG
jgi:hypothetical protein